MLILKNHVLDVFCLSFLVKLLAGNKDMGIDAQVLDQMSLAIAHLVGLGVQVGIVVGGGNLYRGSQLQKDGLVGRVTGDQMGMLATVMNGLALRDALVRRNIKTRLMSALANWYSG